MSVVKRAHNISGIDLTIIYSKRRTIGISVRQDASVIIRVPARTSIKTIEKIVTDKSGWIRKHRDNYIVNNSSQPEIHYRHGELHMYRGNKLLLNVWRSEKAGISFGRDSIDIFVSDPDDAESVKKLLYRGYRQSARQVFPVIMSGVLAEHQEMNFKPSSLTIRKMKRRWGSCSMKGLITLNTELIRLPDRYIEYVITHELCHLRHHNHSSQYYELLSSLYPDWKSVRQEMRKFVI